MLAAVAGLAVVIASAGCKKNSEPAPSPNTPATTAAGAPATATAVAAIVQTTCPVMGNPINKAVFTEYKGQKVYFCCPDCVAKFKADPEKYAAKLPQFKE